MPNFFLYLLKGNRPLWAVSFLLSIFYCLSYSVLPARTAFASWSAQEVDLKPHLTPESFCSISSTVIPSTRIGIALRLPGQPPVKRTFVTTSPFMSKEIFVEQVPCVLYSNCIFHLLCFIFVMINRLFCRFNHFELLVVFDMRQASNCLFFRRLLLFAVCWRIDIIYCVFSISQGIFGHRALFLHGLRNVYKTANIHK